MPDSPAPTTSTSRCSSGSDRIRVLLIVRDGSLMEPCRVWQSARVPVWMRLATAAVLGAAGMAGCASSPSAEPAARAYLSAWGSGDLRRAAALTDDPRAAARALAQVRTDLQVASLQARTTG